MNGYPVSDGEAPPTSSKSHIAEPHQSLTPGIQATFRLSGLFSGAEGLPASRWLNKL